MIKKCVICGREFEANGTRKIYCSQRCINESRNRYYREYRRRKAEQKPFITKECIVCKKMFQTKRKNKIICSPECLKEYNRDYSRWYQKHKKKISPQRGSSSE